MARVFITGSADGLGRAAAQTLLNDGHEVVVHARNRDRLPQTDRPRAPPGEEVLGKARLRHRAAESSPQLSLGSPWWHSRPQEPGDLGFRRSGAAAVLQPGDHLGQLTGRIGEQLMTSARDAARQVILVQARAWVSLLGCEPTPVLLSSEPETRPPRGLIAGDA